MIFLHIYRVEAPEKQSRTHVSNCYERIRANSVKHPAALIAKRDNCVQQD